VRRGEVWWASLPEPTGSGPGSRRPVLVVQANEFNASRIHTVIVPGQCVVPDTRKRASQGLGSERVPTPHGR
jgi:mRNA-degrading endonuclease toxin of MazEF toxin-antitoxin module